MESILESIAQSLEKDLADYIGIFTPILLSTVAILISMWNSFWRFKIKRLDAILVWDDLFNSFFVIIRNTGNKTLVPKTVELVAKGKDETYSLGIRDNVWALNAQQGYIKPNEVLVINPIYGSIYDIFGYKGHAFDVDESNSDLIVSMIVIDVENKKWQFKTSFTMGEIDAKLEYATTIEK